MCISLFTAAVMSTDATKFNPPIDVDTRYPQSERELMIGPFFYIFLFLFLGIEVIILGVWR
jgi:hypothetical protein